jgi:hypothetical protein
VSVPSVFFRIDKKCTQHRRRVPVTPVPLQRCTGESREVKNIKENRKMEKHRARLEEFSVLILR